MASLVNDNLKAGHHSIVWDANRQSSGVYIVKLIAGNYKESQKLMLLK